MGANEKTFYGLSGIGDLNLTCNSENLEILNLVSIWVKDLV